MRALDGFERVAAIGINCTAPQHIASLVAVARANTAKPILVYPNAGEQYDPVSKTWLVGSACGGAHRSYADQAMDWAEGGARLIGGCCRTTPADISALFRRWTASV